MTGGLMQFLILLAAMAAAGAIGFWVARQQAPSRVQDTPENNADWNKMAETIEQLREQTRQAEADKAQVMAEIEWEREQVRAWFDVYQARTQHPAE